MIECLNLSYQYADKLVLNQFNLTIEANEFLAIIGPSGVGKSTLLRLIAGLIPPQQGTLTIDSVAVIKDNLISDKITRQQATKSIGYIFQDLNLFPHLKVIENLTLPYQLNFKTSNIKKAMNLLRSLNIEDKAESYPDQLSGGQKQRVAIARALMLDPSILLVDEATSALDPVRKQEFLSILKSLHKEGMTIVLVTHDHDVAYQWCSRVIEIK